MVDALARGQDPIMTTEAGLRTNGGVIKGGDKPIYAAMTYITGFNRWYMRGTHARGNGPVMTTRAGAQHLRMIHIGG